MQKVNTQNDIESLDSLPTERYENIFNVYQAGSYYYYNILNKVNIPEPINENIVDTIKLDRNLPWTTLSYQIYEDLNLWWLIFLLNKPDNIFIAEAGREYKYILPEYIDKVITSIQSQINK